jgi:hypothetical protein
MQFYNLLYGKQVHTPCSRMMLFRPIVPMEFAFHSYKQGFVLEMAKTAEHWLLFR